MGAGGGIAKVAAPALVQEIAHPRLRPMLASCLYPFFYLGTLLSALLCCGSLCDSACGGRITMLMEIT